MRESFVDPGVVMKSRNDFTIPGDEGSMTIRFIIPRLLVALPFASAAAQAPKTAARICLAPTSVETAAGSASDVMNAVRDAFTSFLTGPSIGVAPLTARLQSQAREEARSSDCPYLLFTSVKHVRKTGGHGLLGRMAGSAVQQGVYTAGAATNSTAGRIVTSATAGAAGAVAYNYASSMKAKDELTLTTRLESASGTVLVEKTEKRKAESDAEDLLTPLVERASTAIAAAVSRRAP